MSDWAEDLAAKAKSEHQAERQSDERFNTEQRLKTSLGAKFWKELTRELDGGATRFNAKFGAPAISVSAASSDTTLSLAVQLSSKIRRTTQASYNPALHAVNWGILDKPGDFHSYQLELVGDSAVVADNGKGVKKSTQEIAREIIEFIVG